MAKEPLMIIGEEAKMAAAKTATQFAARHALIGLDSGTTMAYVMEELGRLRASGKIDISVIVTFYQMLLLAYIQRVSDT